MKKRISILGIALAAIVMFGLSGCQQQTDSSDSKKNALYYVEAGEIAKSDAEAVIGPYKTKYSSSADLTYKDIKDIRNGFRECYLYGFTSEADVTAEKLKDFLTQHGYTPSEAESELSDLYNRGNAIWMFNVKISTEHVAYLYIEEQ